MKHAYGSAPEEKAREQLKVLAYAKLNLVLRIVGKREDGYHLLQSLFCAVDLADEIQLEPLPRGIELWSSVELGPPEKNLAYRAAQTLLSQTDFGVRIVLKKRIPAGAGLGGGSADAAAVLAGLNTLYNLGKTPDELAKIGAKLGADVPFFLGRSPAWVEGIGDRVTPVDLALPAAFLLVIPAFSCPTAAVYQTLDRLGIPPSPPQGVPKIPPFVNDLWPASAHLRPELERIRSVLEGIPSLGVGMSGSGSSLFLAFPSVEEAEWARAELSGRVEAALHVARPVDRGYKIIG
ncbi:MAG: 4-(cytidine 5'-diphospho)-2-C-methyl-D-erythritol kinase [Candidatus Bipolaricaulota bacterium]|nr:4-(cytidine 5'-diphospho)-2-C-methyl-D-erythritol kinase [Candidatus Bipolaricaulota bacterium]MDW8126225.1 4-(cytidine 5'-diphospho)-2-C-methyl-D-erythritol kinase [Candidatus Bipolaricaulota bacterium]